MTTKLRTFKIQGEALYVKAVGDPVGGYPEGKGPLEWTFDLVLNEDGVKELLASGATKSYIKETKDGRNYVRFTRKAIKQDGSKGSPFEIVDDQKKPWDTRKIGNGSILNVSYTLNPVGSGKATKMKPSALAIQVWELVKFQPKSVFDVKEQGPEHQSDTESWEEDK